MFLCVPVTDKKSSRRTKNCPGTTSHKEKKERGEKKKKKKRRKGERTPLGSSETECVRLIPLKV